MLRTNAARLWVGTEKKRDEATGSMGLPREMALPFFPPVVGSPWLRAKKKKGQDETAQKIGTTQTKEGEAPTSHTQISKREKKENKNPMAVEIKQGGKRGTLDVRVSFFSLFFSGHKSRSLGPRGAPTRAKSQTKRRAARQEWTWRSDTPRSFSFSFDRKLSLFVHCRLDRHAESAKRDTRQTKRYLGMLQSDAERALRIISIGRYGRAALDGRAC
nr:hypothetical protein [Pandoravirus massiliensis]